MAGIYIHIPFCASRCSYCDFFSTLQLREAGAPYVEALLAEARMRRQELGGGTVSTLYFGGGTPSLLSHDQLSDIFQAISSVFSLSSLRSLHCSFYILGVISF